MTMLLPEERTTLLEEIGRELLRLDRGKLPLLVPIKYLLNIRETTPPRIYADRILRYCEERAWLDDPSVLLDLLTIARPDAKFEPAIQRIEKQQPPHYHLPAAGPWSTMLLAVDLPFLNRKTTREAIEGFTCLLDPASGEKACRVLVVRGKTGLGKSYTYDYLQYVNRFHGSFKIVWLDVSRQFARGFGPLELAQALLNQINPEWAGQGIYLPTPEGQQPARWVQQLCEVITEQIAYKGQQQVIVLDGLDGHLGQESNELQASFPLDVTEMIGHLAKLATGEVKAAYDTDLLRLVLLGFNTPLRNYWDRLRIDELKPLTAEDVGAYFVNYAAFHGKELPPERLALMVSRTMAGHTEADPQSNQTLARRALLVAQHIEDKELNG